MRLIAIGSLCAAAAAESQITALKNELANVKRTMARMEATLANLEDEGAAQTGHARAAHLPVPARPGMSRTPQMRVHAAMDQGLLLRVRPPFGLVKCATRWRATPGARCLRRLLRRLLRHCGVRQ